jgi:hypothetical protein
MSPQGQPSPRRALEHRAGRLLLGVALLAGLFAATTPSSVEAWTPGPASGHYTPAHIQQLKNSCVWASGQMLLDKWTHGRIRISQAALRRASKATGDGASLFDLARGVARSTGIRLSFSPGFGDSMTWWQLLDRLEHGGGAVLIGMYSRLPSSFSRWNPAFAHSRASRHAVYVERYDRTNARLWLMDPLAPRDFSGEWIGVEALRRFATFRGDLVTAAATSARSRPTTAPLRDQAYQLSGPSVGSPAIAGSSVAVRIGLSIGDGFPLPAAHRLVARWDPVIPPPAAVAPLPFLAPDDASDIAPTVPLPVPTTTSSQPAKPRATGFATSLPVPVVAGLYRLTIGLVKPGDRSGARTLAPVEVQVLPSFAATYSFPNSLQLTAGQPFTLNAGIRNIGTTDWRPARSPDGRRPGDVRTPASEATQTMLVLTWRSRLGDEFRAAELPTELAPGASVRLQIAMAAPTAPGTWTLVGDIVSRDLGSMAAEGLDGPSLAVTVRPGPGADQPPRG